jgi:predicted nucleotide-binding protein
MNLSNQVFISYGHHDQEWVRQFVEELTREGINVWLGEEEIALGEPIADKLEEALRSSETLILIFDPESVHSSNLFFELGAALGAGKRVIAIVDKDVPAKDLPAPIRMRRYLLKEKPEETARDVAKALIAAG